MWLCTLCVAARSVTHDLVNSSQSFHTDWAGDAMFDLRGTNRTSACIAQAVLLVALGTACDRHVPASTGSARTSSSASLVSPHPPVAADTVDLTPIAPLIDESNEYVCFLADPTERERGLPGWVMPLPNRDKPQTTRSKNPFTGVEMVLLDYSNPVKPKAPATSGDPQVGHLHRLGTILVGRERLAFLINAIDGTPVEEVEGQIAGQTLLSSSAELGVVFRVPQHFVQRLATLPVADISTVANRWKPSLAAGPQYGNEANQPPPQKRKDVLAAAVELSSLAMKTKRDVFIWERDF